MAKLPYKCGDVLDVPYSASVSSGDFVDLGPIIVQAETDGDANGTDPYAAKTEGVYYGATKVSGTAFAVWDLLQYDAANERWTKDASLPTRGVAVAAAGSSAVVCDVLLLEGKLDGMRVYSGGSATAVTASATETVSQTATIPAGDLQSGDILLIDAGVTATSTTSTETVTGKIRIDGLTGSVVASTAAVDVADADEAFLAGQVNIKTAGAAAASEINGHGTGFWDTNGTMLGSGFAAVTTLDTTAAITVVVTITNSSSGESCIAHDLKVVRIRPTAI